MIYKWKTMRKKGFTLIELLVVLGILGILSGIIIANYSNVKKLVKARKVVGDC